MTQTRTSIADADFDEHVAVKSDAADARESFPAYLAFAGRSEHGSKLRLDPPMIEGAKDMERAYREGKDYANQESRGLLKTSRNVAFLAWVTGRDPNLSTTYITNRKRESESRNKWLQAQMSTGEHRAVFGEKGTPLVTGCNASSTTIKGKASRNSPNVHASGIEGERGGDHYDLIMCDDVCDEKSSLAQPMRKYSIKQIYHTTIMPMLNDRNVAAGRLGVGMKIHTGTVYATDDLNADIVKVAQNNPDTWVYRRLACGGPPDFFTPCPSVISSATLRGLWTQSPRAYEMNYMLVAITEGERPFRNIHYWLPEGWKTSNRQVQDLGFLPIFLPRKEYGRSLESEWFCGMAVDPGFTDKRGSSATGIIIWKLGLDRHIYLLFASKKRQAWDKTVDEIPRLYADYRCNECLIEDAAQQVSVQSQLREKGILNVRGVSTGSKSKEIRAMDVSGEVNFGRVLLPGTMERVDGKWTMLPINREIEVLRDDLLAFPGIEQKDLVDAFVYGVQSARERMAPRAEEEQPAKENWEQRAIRLYLEEHTAPAEDPERPTDEWDAIQGINEAAAANSFEEELVTWN